MTIAPKSMKFFFKIFETVRLIYIFFLVNGGWSRWHTQSKCSVSCGGGVKVQVRYCDNPPPRSGGQQCSGVSTQSVPCNTRLCPGNFYLKNAR